MKVQCDVCEKAVASVICCADEAALCSVCDTRVHAANKLANKHQRVPLISASESPSCDICQEKSAFFFCLEDRALLCRDCDVSIHSANAISSTHQRFLVPGTKVALEALSNYHESAETPSAEDFARHPLCSTGTDSQMMTRTSTIKPPSFNSKPASYSTAYSRPLPNLTPPYSSPTPMKLSPTPTKANVVNTSLTQISHSGGGGGWQASHGVSVPLAHKSSLTEFLSEAIPNWRIDELLAIPDLADGYSLGDIASSKADVANLGDYDWTADLSLFDEQVLHAESFHEVPQMPSPPTASGVLGRGGRGFGVMKGKAKQDSIVPDNDDAFVVPDLGLQSGPASPPVAKRRRQFAQM